MFLFFLINVKMSLEPNEGNSIIVYLINFTLKKYFRQNQYMTWNFPDSMGTWNNTLPNELDEHNFLSHFLLFFRRI